MIFWNKNPRRRVCIGGIWSGKSLRRRTGPIYNLTLILFRVRSTLSFFFAVTYCDCCRSANHFATTMIVKGKLSPYSTHTSQAFTWDHHNRKNRSPPLSSRLLSLPPHQPLSDVLTERPSSFPPISPIALEADRIKESWRITTPRHSSLPESFRPGTTSAPGRPNTSASRFPSPSI